MHPLKFVKEITKENDVASDFTPDLGLCSSSADETVGSPPAFQFQLISGQCVSVNSCILWLLKLTLNRMFQLKLRLFQQ